MNHIHYRTCNLCEAMCGIQITLDAQNRIQAIEGDPEDPFSRGHICPKAVALKDIYEDPNRLRHPMRRTPQGWERIGWDEALDTVAAKLLDIQNRYGADAVGVYQGNPNAHNLGSMLYSPPFVRALRTKNRFSATSVDQLPHHFAAYFMFGHQLLLPIPDIDHTDYLLILGANPIASNGSLMTAGGFSHRLKALQARGGKCVVIDPRKTETAKRADEHHFIRPGTDVLLLLAMVNHLIASKQTRLGHLQDHLIGFKRLTDLVAPYTATKVAEATGIPAETITRITDAFASAERAICYGRVGLSMQAFGGLCQWLINVINIITANFDRVGGAMFPLPAIDVVGITALTGQTGNFNRWRSRVRGLPEFGGELPSAVMAEEILTEGEGQIRAMVTMAGNPVLSTPNGAQLDRALAQLDFMVSIDIYINETTRHAHIILPPTTGLENDHYDLIFHNLAVRNTAKFSPALYSPPADARHDWEILMALRERIERAKGKGAIQRKDYLKRLPPHKILDLALRFGPYGRWGGRNHGATSLKLARLKENPHGVDLGPMQPCLPDRLCTSDKRIHLAPEAITHDMKRLADWHDSLGRTDQTQLALIGRRHLRSNNSWMHNSERLVRGKNRCTLLINPADAERRGLQNGDTALVTSRVGRVTIEVEVTADIMPGVVSIPHGWGHNKEGTQLDIANQYAGVSINDLTDDQYLDALTGNAAFTGVPVTVEPVGELS